MPEHCSLQRNVLSILLVYWSHFAPAMQSIELVEESSHFILKISLFLFRYSFYCFLNSSLLNSRQRRDKGCRHFTEPCDDWIIGLCLPKTDLNLKALRWNDLDSPWIRYWNWIVSIYIIQFVTHFNKELRQKQPYFTIFHFKHFSLFSIESLHYPVN